MVELSLQSPSPPKVLTCSHLVDLSGGQSDPEAIWGPTRVTRLA